MSDSSTHGHILIGRGFQRFLGSIILPTAVKGRRPLAKGLKDDMVTLAFPQEHLPIGPASLVLQLYSANTVADRRQHKLRLTLSNSILDKIGGPHYPARHSKVAARTALRARAFWIPRLDNLSSETDVPTQKSTVRSHLLPNSGPSCHWGTGTRSQTNVGDRRRFTDRSRPNEATSSQAW
jgi:hypothetical protein